MLAYVTIGSIFAVGIALMLNLYRFIIGPHILDRITALDTMYINAIALILLLGIYKGSPLYYEGALFIALLGFVSTTAVCKFILRGDVME